jgi:hypothetical protein
MNCNPASKSVGAGAMKKVRGKIKRGCQGFFTVVEMAVTRAAWLD